MRQHHRNPEPETSKPARMEPLDEGFIRTSRGREWSRMGKETLVAHAKEFIAEKGISGRKELKKADKGLYDVLRKMELLDDVGLEEKNRDWAGMGMGKLVAHAKEFIAEKRINGRWELQKADPGLYEALRGRKLLDEVGLEYLRREMRDWAVMGKEELVAHAKKFIGEKEISGRAELAKADLGLYQALLKRKLLDEVGLEYLRREMRDWAVMGKEELVAFAKGFISEREVRWREELKKADLGLYQALRRRKLLDEVFSDAESSKHADAVNGVIGALESFGDDE
jgi:hypothetical protein